MDFSMLGRIYLLHPDYENFEEEKRKLARAIECLENLENEIYKFTNSSKCGDVIDNGGIVTLANDANGMIGSYSDINSFSRELIKDMKNKRRFEMRNPNSNESELMKQARNILAYELDNISLDNILLCYRNLDLYIIQLEMIFDGCLTESKKNVMYEFSKAKDVLKNAIAHHLVEFIVPRKDKSGKYIFNLKTTRKNPRTVTIDMDHVRTTTIKRFVRSCLALFISDELRLIFDQFLERRLISYGQKFTKMRITPRIIEDLVRREIDIALFWFGREIFDDEAIKRHDRDFRKQMIFKCWELDFFHLNREVIDQKIAFSKYICRLFADGLKNFDFEDFEYQKEVLDEAMNGMHLNSSTKNLHKPAVLARMFTLDLLRKLAKSRLSGKDIVDL